MEKQFLDYAKTQSWWPKFLVNMVNENRDTKEYFKRCSLEDFVKGAFYWSMSNEGFEFWDKIDKAWKEYVKNSYTKTYIVRFVTKVNSDKIRETISKISASRYHLEEIVKTDEERKQWLKRRDWYPAFLVNLVEYGKNPITYISDFINNDILVSGAFTWSTTNQGQKYWEEKSSSWRNFFNSIKVNLTITTSLNKDELTEKLMDLTSELTIEEI